MTGILDCNDRDFDTTIMYYGCEDIKNLSEFDIRNHNWNARIDGKIPRIGKYCTPDELQDIVQSDGIGTISSLNSKFRNVQYIESGDMLYWIYCMRSDNLYNFKFIGDNLTPGIIEYLMQSNGFELGYTHFISESSYSDLWYNPERLYLAVFQFEEGVLISKQMYFKMFDSCTITKTNITTDIFGKDKYRNIPLTSSLEYDELSKENTGKLPWSYHINMNETTLRPEMLYTADYYKDTRSARFSKVSYDEMVYKLFNGRRSTCI